MLRLLALGKSRDDLAKRAQGQVDGLKLQQVLGVKVFLLADLLGASQVAQVELASEHDASLVRLILLHQYLEYSVGPAGVDVGLGLPGDPVFLASLE